MKIYNIMDKYKYYNRRTFFFNIGFIFYWFGQYVIPNCTIQQIA